MLKTNFMNTQKSIFRVSKPLYMVLLLLAVGLMTVSCDDNDVQSTIPAPMINDFTPTSGIVGTQVTITGSNMASVEEVSIGGAIIPIDYWAETSLLITINNDVVTGKIQVVGEGGTSTSDVDFLLLHGPVITSFAPASGTVGDEVTITGGNLSDVTEVSIGGIVVAIDSQTDTSIKVTLTDQVVSGKIVVVNAGGSAESDTDFIFETPLTITSISPASGPIGTVVTITGTALLTVTEVLFGNIPTTINSGASDTEIKVNVPDGVALGDVIIKLINANGYFESGTPFTVEAPSSNLPNIVLATFESGFDPGANAANWIWNPALTILEEQTDPTDSSNQILRLKGDNGTEGYFGAGSDSNPGLLGVEDTNIDDVYINVDVWAESGFEPTSILKIYTKTEGYANGNGYGNYYINVTWTGKKTVSIPMSHFKYEDGAGTEFPYDGDPVNLDMIGFEGAPGTGTTSIYIDNLIISQSGQALGEILP
jgi:hypothetical protein